MAIPLHRLFWSMSIHFVAVQSSAAENLEKITSNLYFGGSRSFMGVSFDTTACLCLSASVFMLDKPIAEK